MPTNYFRLRNFFKDYPHRGCEIECCGCGQAEKFCTVNLSEGFQPAAMRALVFAFRQHHSYCRTGLRVVK